MISVGHLQVIKGTSLQHLGKTHSMTRLNRLCNIQRHTSNNSNSEPNITVNIRVIIKMSYYNKKVVLLLCGDSASNDFCFVENTVTTGQAAMKYLWPLQVFSLFTIHHLHLVHLLISCFIGKNLDSIWLVGQYKHKSRQNGHKYNKMLKGAWS